jgi:hypothetical protein
MVFVNLGENGEPAPHGRTQIRYADEAFKRYRADLSPATSSVTSVEDTAARIEADTMH